MAVKRRFVLSHHRSPGDLVCLSALVRDIHIAYPGKYETDFNTTVQPIWQNSPYITNLWNHNEKAPRMLKPGTEMIQCQYKQGLTDSNHEAIHFCHYFHRDFERQTGIHVPPSRPYGDIHLSDHERTVSPVKGRYWLLLSGGKSDFTIKVWNTACFQAVVDAIGDLGLGVIQTGAAAGGHWHPALTGPHLLNLCGWGGFREFVQQIYHADGVICGVTAAMHIAAALQKPCVVLAGGRESWWWEAYVRENKGLGDTRTQLKVPHRFLHTIGQLDCCMNRGCWRDKVVKIDKSNSLCKRPIITPEMPVAECMKMITPEMVMTAVLSYYHDGTITTDGVPGLADYVQASVKDVKNGSTSGVP